MTDHETTTQAACALSPRREPCLLAAWIALIVGLTIIPHIVACMHTDDENVYVGHLNAGILDCAFHLSWAKQAEEGFVLMENKVNGDDVRTRLIFNPYLYSIGLLARTFQIPVVVAYQIVRPLGCAALLYVVFQLAQLLFDDRFRRWLALIFVSLSSGVGWLEMLGLPHYWATYIITTPLDLNTPEISTFLHLRWEVLTTPTVLLMLIIFWQGMRYWRSGERTPLFAASSTTLLLGLVHPHNLITIGLLGAVLMGLAALFLRGGPERRRLHRLLRMIVLFSAPAAFYQWLILELEPSLWNYAEQVDLHLNSLRLVGGYGLIGLLAIPGALAAIRRRHPEQCFFVLWTVCGLTMLFIRVPPLGQVFALDGLHVALCLLAAAGLRTLPLGWNVSAHSPRAARVAALWGRRACLAGVVLLSSMTSLLAFANEMVLATQSGRPPFRYRLLDATLKSHAQAHGIAPGAKRGSHMFIPRPLSEAMEWLDENSSPSDCLLPEPTISTLAAARTGSRVHLGHPSVTANYRRGLYRYYYYTSKPDVISDDQFQNYLRLHRTDYWFRYLPQPLAQDALRERIRQLETRSGMKAVFSNARVVILQSPLASDATVRGQLKDWY